MLTPREFDLTIFPNGEHYDELVLDTSIRRPATCSGFLLAALTSAWLSTAYDPALHSTHTRNVRWSPALPLT